MLVPRLGLPVCSVTKAHVWSAVTLIAIVVITLVALAADGRAELSFLRHSGESLPLLAHRMAEIIDNSRDQPAIVVDRKSMPAECRCTARGRRYLAEGERRVLPGRGYGLWPLPSCTSCSAW
jgi:hypothetical protein